MQYRTDNYFISIIVTPTSLMTEGQQFQFETKYPT